MSKCPINMIKDIKEGNISAVLKRLETLTGRTVKISDKGLFHDGAVSLCFSLRNALEEPIMKAKPA